MPVKKTIWIPIVIGFVSSILIVLASETHFLIPVGDNLSAGIGEIFTTFTAALGGPIAVIIALLLTYGGVFILSSDLYPDMQSIYIALADCAAHLGAMLVFAICYYKFLYPRARNTSSFLVGWWLTVGAYYYLALMPLAIVLLNLADPSYGLTYSAIARGLFVESLVTATITTLIWFALPTKYRRQQWIGPKHETQDE